MACVLINAKKERLFVPMVQRAQFVVMKTKNAMEMEHANLNAPMEQHTVAMTTMEIRFVVKRVRNVIIESAKTCVQKARLFVVSMLMTDQQFVAMKAKNVTVTRTAVNVRTNV